MTFWFLVTIYLMFGTGFGIAAEEIEPDRWKWWTLLAFILAWPIGVAYAIGKVKVE